MKTVILRLALMAGQAITLQDKPVVHLKPNTNQISVAFDGALLELLRSPATITLPAEPPPTGSTGDPWSLDVKNFGPYAVMITGRGGFSAQVAVGQTVHILSNGRAYSLKH